MNYYLNYIISFEMTFVYLNDIISFEMTVVYPFGKVKGTKGKNRFFYFS